MYIITKSFIVQPTRCSRKFRSKSEIIFVWEVHLSTVIVSKNCLTSLLYLGSVMLIIYTQSVCFAYKRVLVDEVLFEIVTKDESIWFHVSTPSVFTSTHTWIRTHLLSSACSGFSTLMDCMLDTNFTQNSCYMHCTMICKHAQNHPKVDCTKHPILDDLETHSLSSKTGSYKTTNFGRCIIIQKWIIQNFHLYMICKHAQNHPKVDYTKLLPLDDLQARSESSKNGLYKTSKFE